MKNKLYLEPLGENGLPLHNIANIDSKLMITDTKLTSNLALKWQLLKTAVISCIFNNGWRRYDSIKDYEKQQSFNALPKTNRYYDIVVNGEIQYNYYYGGCISSDSWVDRNVTHFRESKRYKLPIF